MKALAALSALLLIGGWLYLVGTSALKEMVRLIKGGGGKRDGNRLKQLLMEKPFLHLLQWLCHIDTFNMLLNGYHLRLFILNGMGWTMERTKLLAAAAFGYGYAAMSACALLTILSGESMVLLAGLLAFVGLAFRDFAEADKKVERRKRVIMATLPDRMSKLMLLVGAGDTVQGAFARCLEGREGSMNPLDKEWRAAISAIHNGQSFSTALERFNRSCAVQEASLFTTVMLLNYRKGGEHFVLAVRELSYSLWEKRKGIARISGEEASSKLVFPLAGIMFIMMIIVAAPAVLLMG